MNDFFMALIIGFCLCLIAAFIVMFLTRHRHKWEVIDTVTVTRGRGFPEEKVYVCQCSGCGKIKKFYV